MFSAFCDFAVFAICDPILMKFFAFFVPIRFIWITCLSSLLSRLSFDPFLPVKLVFVTKFFRSFFIESGSLIVDFIESVGKKSASVFVSDFAKVVFINFCFKIEINLYRFLSIY